MAASNYMTESEFESVWNTSIDTTRFGNIGVRIAEFCNFKIYRNATTQCTNTAVTPLLEQFSEEVLLLALAAAKIEASVNPWEFVQGNIMRFLVQHYNVWREIFDDIRLIESQEHVLEFVSISDPD